MVGSDRKNLELKPVVILLFVVELAGWLFALLC